MSSTLSTLAEINATARLRAAELTVINESLQRRECLLAASAKASRLLLEAADVMAAMPFVLQLLGEAAEVDRTTFALAEIGPQDEHWLVIKSEWTADGISQRCNTDNMAWNERKSDCYCTELRSGRSVCVYREDTEDAQAVSITSDHAKSSIIVPILIDAEYAGAIGFDDCRNTREFDPAVVSALEIAASLVGAALHRERLVDTMRREREQATEARVAQLAHANAMLRGNLEQLASDPDLSSFMEHLTLGVTQQLDAASGTVVVLDLTASHWIVAAHVREGSVAEPTFAKSVPVSNSTVADAVSAYRAPQRFVGADLLSIPWPGAAEFHQRGGSLSAYVVPLLFGDLTVGFIALGFRRVEAVDSEQAELLVAAAQQATFAVAMKRLASTAKNAAVLAERNRIGQEIHDGLAQAFTGILMQLGAAEEFMGCAKDSPLPVILTRIRDLAREGLSEARRSVLALRPEERRPGGLEMALRQLAERSTIPGRVACSFEGASTMSGPAPEHQHELLRIAQEAVINAARHAQPKSISISFAEEPLHWVLTVKDDGCGMEALPELYAKQGFGLANMHERAQAIGGICQIVSKPNEGTQVQVRLPRKMP